MKKLHLITCIAICLFCASCSYQKSLPQIETFDQIEYPFTVNKVLLQNEIEVAYFDEGSGTETLLFIHGLGSYAPAWKKNIASLKQQYRCIAIDLPGYGKSSKGNYEGSMSYYADIINDFCQKMNLEKVTLVGHSMGGQISIMTSLAYPEQVDKLILVAPAGFEKFTPGQSKWFRNVLSPTAIKFTPIDNIIKNIGDNFYKMPDDAKFMISDRIAMRDAKDFDAYCYIIPQCIKGMVDQPVFDYLNKINQKTLVIYGDNDNLIPNRFLNPGTTKTIAKKGAEQIPNCRLEMVNKAGHFVQFEQSEKVNALITDFLK